MERKRAESDVFNVQEFCHRLPLNESENSCARTEAVLISRKGSKSHLKGEIISFQEIKVES
jgi:molybdopterin synthase catalytic subunit